MTVGPAFLEPSPERPPTGRRVISYVHALNPIQRAYELKLIADFCRDEHYRLVHTIEDDCLQQHTTVDCPAFFNLIEYLTRDLVDLVLPSLDHLSTDAIVISLRLDRIDATRRQIFIVPSSPG